MSELVQDTADRLTAFISQNYSNADTAPGSVISELVVKLAASLQNQQYNTINSLSQGEAVSQVLASNSDTYSNQIDLIASNYNTVRSQGSYSTGNVQVYVTAQNSYSISANFQFIQPVLGLTYQVTKAFRISPNPNPVLGELQLFAENNQYYFILPVIATSVGYPSQLSSGTTLAINAPGAISNFVSAKAYGNFTSGLPKETDKQLISRFKKTLGSTRFESPVGIANRLSAIYPTFQTLSVCGANDIEMTRSKQNALGISTFGMADVYVRNTVGPETYTATATGTKIGQGVWQLNLDSLNYCAGFYNVTTIIPNTTVLTGGTLPITNVTYGYRPFADQLNNVITGANDARFSNYQTAQVTFTYNEIPVVDIGTTAEFVVSANYQPNIGDIQNLMLSSDERLACADYLVKAALPCFVSLNIPLVAANPNDTFTSLNLNSLKQDIFNYINTIPFGENVYASKIITLCHNYKISRVELPITLIGDILCNDGSTLTITDTDKLQIPTNIPLGVSPKTTQFFINYYNTSTSTGNVIDNIGIQLL
jgi:hypothetical protein